MPKLSITPVISKVVIFHCEFSSKRGPKMCRYVRKTDRTMNKQNYPKLFYPEIYILHGGYKVFVLIPATFTNCSGELYNTFYWYDFTLMNTIGWQLSSLIQFLALYCINLKPSQDFYPKFPGLCIPQNYTLMLDPLFETELAHWLKVTKQVTGK